MHMSNDDFIETDGGVHNVRVFQNRGVNAAQGGYSSQPVFGGPVYFFRNILYNVPTGVAFKFSAKPAGLFVWHNTIIGEQVVREVYANAHFRNNLFLGRDTPERGVMAWANANSSYSTDYNGFRPNQGVSAQYAFYAPKPGSTPYAPRAEEWVIVPTLAALREATGQEKHGMEVDYDIFEGVVAPNPANRHAVYHAMDLDFRLKPGPTINDGYAGRAPDLGALEAGQALPVWGPVWLQGKQPFYR
jgi:hypothetical protein